MLCSTLFLNPRTLLKTWFKSSASNVKFEKVLFLHSLKMKKQANNNNKKKHPQKIFASSFISITILLAGCKVLTSTLGRKTALCDNFLFFIFHLAVVFGSIWNLSCWCCRSWLWKGWQSLAWVGAYWVEGCLIFFGLPANALCFVPSEVCQVLDTSADARWFIH